MDKSNIQIIFLLIYIISFIKTTPYTELVGCIFYPSVCQPFETCFNDSLFGSCYNNNTSSKLDKFHYSLSSKQLGKLKFLFHLLDQYNLTWFHMYTQCIISTALTSFLLKIDLKFDICELFTKDQLINGGHLENEIYEGKMNYGSILSNNSLIPVNNFLKDPLVNELKKEQKLNVNSYFKLYILLAILLFLLFVGSLIVYFIYEREKKKMIAWLIMSTNDDKTSSYKILCREKSECVKENLMLVSQSSESMYLDNQSKKPVQYYSPSHKSMNLQKSSLSLDISTSHLILSFIESYLNDKNKLTKEWEYLNSHSDILNTSYSDSNSKDTRINSSDVKLLHSMLVSDGQDPELNVNHESPIQYETYLINDLDVSFFSRLICQAPAADNIYKFWQMIWIKQITNMVNLVSSDELVTNKIAQYWPSDNYIIYENLKVQILSTHQSCQDFVVQNFLLENLEKKESRIVTQFHYLIWPPIQKSDSRDGGIPTGCTKLLEFRDLVNSSFRLYENPLLVHCSDGLGRTGVYCLIDLILNKIYGGVREICLVASLELLREQRPGLISNQKQYEFVLEAVADYIRLSIEKK